MSHHRCSVNTNETKSWIDAKPRADTIRHDHHFTAQIWHSINTAARRRQAVGRRLNARRIAGWRLDTVRVCRWKEKGAQRRNFTRINRWSEFTFFIIYPLCVQKNRSASSYFLLLSWTPRGAQKKKKEKKSHSLIHYDCLTLKEGSLPSRTLGKFKYHAYKCKQWLMRQEGGGHSRPQRGIIWFTIRVLPFFNHHALRYCLIWSQLIFECLNWYSMDRRCTKCS